MAETPTSQELKNYARSIGVDLIGITPADPDPVAEIKLQNYCILQKITT